MTALRRILTATLALLVFTTCEEFPEDPTGTDTAGPIQLSIQTVDWPQFMALGGLADLEVDLTDSQGRSIPDLPLTWSITTPSTGVFDSGGTGTTATVTGTGLGWLRITVGLEDADGRFEAAERTDSVQVMVAGVEIHDPGIDTTLTALGEVLTARAQAVDAQGNPLDGEAFNWDVFGTGALSQITVGADYLDVQADAPGRDTVRVYMPGACAGGVCEDRMVVTVEQQVQQVLVTPDAPTIERDSTLQLTAEAIDGNANTIVSATFDWISSNTGVATVSSTGLVTGVAVGTATISATEQGSSVGDGVEVRVIPGRGTATGTVYRDDDASGTYDVNFDTPLPGATVELIEGTNLAGTVVGTTTTTLGGVYTFDGVPAGDYVVSVAPLPGTTIDPAAKQATVVEEQTVTTDFTYTGAVVGPIADARAAALDEIVAIEGVATSATTGAGSLQDSLFFIQDGSAAIAVTMAAADFPGGYTAVAIGDSLRVVGVRQAAPDQTVWIEAESVIGLGFGRADTLDLFAGDVNAFSHPSRLTRVDDVIVDSITGVRNEFVWARDMETGGVGFRMYLNEATALDGATSFIPHRAYTVTGIMTRQDAGFVIKPRMAGDIETGLMPVTSIGTARNLTPDSMWISVEGVVSAGTDAFGAQTFYMQDATAGIRVYMHVDTFPDGLPTVTAGDSVRIQGARWTYNEEAEIMASYVAVEGFAGEPVPYGISASEINTDAGQGELHAVFEVLVDSVVGSFSEYVWVSDPGSGGEDLQLFMDADIGITGPEAFTVGNYYDVTGVVGRHLANRQLKPRGGGDIEEVIMPILIADARAAGAGTELAVSGVLSAGVDEFDAAVMYVQDGTGGIQLFFPGADFPTVPNLAVGDSVRVTGFRADVDGVPRIDVYEVNLYGNGFPVDTLASDASDASAGLNPGELVRLDQMRAIEVAGGLTRLEDAFGQGIWVRTDHLPVGSIGIDGVYDLVGVVSWLDAGGIYWLMPRGDFDVATITPPSNLWATFVNVPTWQVDTVVFSYTVETWAEPYQEADRSPIHYGTRVPASAGITWAWVAWSAGQGVGYRSLDLGRQLDGGVDVAVIPCLQAACAAGDGMVANPLTRSFVQADYEFYGLFPSQESADYNEGMDDAYALETVFLDELEGREYWAHTGHLQAGDDLFDFYTFYASAGDAVTVETFARRVAAEGDLDTYLKVFNPNMSQVAENDDIQGEGTFDSRVTFTAPLSGYYIVQVDQFTGSGVYTLLITVDY